MEETVKYMELVPSEFRRRLAAAPIAYMPLGTLEWHGEHLPLGADGLQSQGFFEILAREVGGIVLPPLYLGPDRAREVDGVTLYGMDFCTADPAHAYADRQLAGSAYWVPGDLFVSILDAAVTQLARAGFKIVVGHGHGPSTKAFAGRIDEWKSRFGLECFTCWGGEHDREGLGIQVDHAAKNETSLVMALRPELVHMELLPASLGEWPAGIGGQDPRVHASRELGEKAIELNKNRMAKLLRDALARLA